jgi:hypothetical protein
MGTIKWIATSGSRFSASSRKTNADADADYVEQRGKQLTLEN